MQPQRKPKLKRPAANNMMPSALTLARLCLASETNPVGFDYIDNGADTGVWWGLVRQQDQDIICFRGSITLEDWMRDAHAEMISFPVIGLVHSGFIQGMPEAMSRIKGMTRPNSIILTGHSLGAARAAIFAGMIEGKAAQVTLFGCPRPGGEQLKDLLKDTPIDSFKNREDPVTDVPLPLPDAPYIHVKNLTPIDGLVDHSLGPIFDDHHIINYCQGLKNAESNTSS